MMSSKGKDYFLLEAFKNASKDRKLRKDSIFDILMLLLQKSSFANNSVHLTSPIRSNIATRTMSSIARKSKYRMEYAGGTLQQNKLAKYKRQNHLKNVEQIKARERQVKCTGVHYYRLHPSIVRKVGEITMSRCFQKGKCDIYGKKMNSARFICAL